MKLPREAYAMWLSFDKENWTILGRDTDTMEYGLNPDVSTDKNVIGETVVNHNGFAPELSVDTYRARTDDAIYENILDIAMNRKSDEESTAAYLLEAVLSESVDNSKIKTLTGKGWMEEVVVVPQSTGGDLSGFGIPFNINPNGGRVEGTVSVTNKAPTFTPGGASGASLDESAQDKSVGSLSD